MAIFNSYVSLPEGIHPVKDVPLTIEEFSPNLTMDKLSKWMSPVNGTSFIYTGYNKNLAKKMTMDLYTSKFYPVNSLIFPLFGTSLGPNNAAAFSRT